MKNDFGKKNKKKEIVKTSLLIIYNEGINSLTTKKISQDMGCSEGTIFYYFNSKSEILQAIIQDITNNIKQQINYLSDSNDDPIKKIEKLFFVSHEEYKENLYYLPMLFSLDSIKNEEEIYEHINENINKYNESILINIINGQQKGYIKRDMDPVHLLYLIIGSLNMVLHNWYKGNIKDIQKENIKLWETIKGFIIEDS